MALSQTTLKFVKILYWLILSVGNLYLCYLLITSGRSMAGILMLVFGFMLIYILYPYYFPPGTGSGLWPPYITACPDYLSLVRGNDCMDFVGMGSPLLKKADRAHPPQPTDSDYAQYVFDNSGTTAQKASRAQQYGLSWQGVA
jgi:hypothetical protein